MMDSSLVSFPRRRLADHDEETFQEKSFVLPNVADPAAYAQRHFDVYKGDHDGELKMKFAKGTTVRDIHSPRPGKRLALPRLALPTSSSRADPCV
jgi:hypothetical protein